MTAIAYATAIFLLGWATDGLAFGILGDQIGRARTILLIRDAQRSLTLRPAQSLERSVAGWDLHPLEIADLRDVH